MLFPNTRLFCVFKHVKPNMSSLSKIMNIIVIVSLREVGSFSRDWQYMLIDIVPWDLIIYTHALNVWVKWPSVACLEF